MCALRGMVHQNTMRFCSKAYAMTLQARPLAALVYPVSDIQVETQREVEEMAEACGTPFVRQGYQQAITSTRCLSKAVHINVLPAQSKDVMMQISRVCPAVAAQRSGSPGSHQADPSIWNLEAGTGRATHLIKVALIELVQVELVHGLRLEQAQVGDIVGAESWNGVVVCHSIHLNQTQPSAPRINLSHQQDRPWLLITASIFCRLVNSIG